MNHWPFIAGAYAAALLGTLGLVASSFLAMRRAEREADSLGSGR
jgi:hypothetical protein